MASWNAKGFEAMRINSVDSVLQAVRAYEAFVKMSEDELRQQHMELGLPEGRGLPRATMLRNIKTLLVWEVLPLRELQTECRERGLPCHQGLPTRSVNERRDALVQ